jgi:hypothetical protein
MCGQHNYRTKLCVKEEADLSTLLLMGALFVLMKLDWRSPTENRRAAHIEVELDTEAKNRSAAHRGRALRCSESRVAPDTTKFSDALGRHSASQVHTTEQRLLRAWRHLGPPSMAPQSLLRVAVQRGALKANGERWRGGS